MKESKETDSASVGIQQEKSKKCNRGLCQL